MDNVPRRYNTYTNKDNITYDKVKELAFKQKELMNNLGKFVNETNREANLFFDDQYSLENGVYIYQDYNNPNIAYRIYKEFAEYNFNGNKDELLIQELMQKQDKVKLTEFPFGVVTLDNRIIGQQIPYYPNHISLYEYFKANKDIDIYMIYLQILDILNELYSNGILYFDSHAKNYLINGDTINLIDFEYSLMSFDINNIRLKKYMLKNYIKLINHLYQLYSNTKQDIFEETNSFGETYNQIKELTRKIA